MEKYCINIARDFGIRPGGRWKALGPLSGEEFFESLLEPQFVQADKDSLKLHIYLDGCRSYPHSFLDQSFGELARKYSKEKMREVIEFHANEKAHIIDYINKVIWA